jgi:hypothetical protein
VYYIRLCIHAQFDADRAARLAVRTLNCPLPSPGEADGRGSVSVVAVTNTAASASATYEPRDILVRTDSPAHNLPPAAARLHDTGDVSARRLSVSLPTWNPSPDNATVRSVGSILAGVAVLDEPLQLSLPCTSSPFSAGHTVALCCQAEGHLLPPTHLSVENPQNLPGLELSPSVSSGPVHHHLSDNHPNAFAMPPNEACVSGSQSPVSAIPTLGAGAEAGGEIRSAPNLALLVTAPAHLHAPTSAFCHLRSAVASRISTREGPGRRGSSTDPLLLSSPTKDQTRSALKVPSVVREGDGKVDCKGGGARAGELVDARPSRADGSADPSTSKLGFEFAVRKSATATAHLAATPRRSQRVRRPPKAREVGLTSSPTLANPARPAPQNSALESGHATRIGGARTIARTTNKGPTAANKPSQAPPPATPPAAATRPTLLSSPPASSPTRRALSPTTLPAAGSAPRSSARLSAKKAARLKFANAQTPHPVSNTLTPTRSKRKRRATAGPPVAFPSILALKPASFGDAPSDLAGCALTCFTRKQAWPG